MMGAVRRALETIGGLWELLWLLIRSRFRLSSPYWQWRMETAFGTDPSTMPSRSQRFRQVIAYGRWVYRMKRSG